MKKKKENKTEYGTVSLPIPLINKIKERIEGTGMPSVSAYVAFVLRQVLSSTGEKENIIDKRSEEELKSRLRSLGY